MFFKEVVKRLGLVWVVFCRFTRLVPQVCLFMGLSLDQVLVSKLI